MWHWKKYFSLSFPQIFIYGIFTNCFLIKITFIFVRFLNLFKNGTIASYHSHKHLSIMQEKILKLFQKNSNHLTCRNQKLFLFYLFHFINNKYNGAIIHDYEPLYLCTCMKWHFSLVRSRYVEVPARKEKDPKFFSNLVSFFTFHS